MKKSKYIFLAMIIIFISSFILTYESMGQKQGKGAIKSSPEKSKVLNKYIWIEGENAVSTNFAREKTYNFFCSGRHALQLSKEAAPTSSRGYYATYIFFVPEEGDYEFWLAGTPPGSKLADRPGYSSPFEWEIDDEEFKKASSENVQVKGYYAPGGYYWTKISTGKLTKGKHSLNIRVKQKRSSGWDYFFYIDALLFISKSSIKNSGSMKFPGPVPENFNMSGKGLTLKDKNYYLKRVKKRQRAVVFDLLQIYGWLYENTKAIELCRTYLKNHPKDIQIRILLASNLAWADRLDDAIKEYKNIIRIDNKNITARKLLAVLAGWNNRYDEAIKNYREIIAIDPKNIDAYISLANQLSWRGEVEQALDTFEKGEKIAPGNVEVLYALGDNYYWSGKTYKAIKKFKEIISIDEKEIPAYKKLAGIYLDTGNESRARSTIEDARLVQAKYPELAGFSLDIEGEKNKKLKETIREYKTLLRNNPENIEARKSLIDTFRWNKLEKEAVVEYNNLLNVKLYKKISDEEGRLTSMEVETIKFQLLGPVLKKIKSELTSLKEQYQNQAQRLKDGKPLGEKFNKNKVLTDYHELKKIKEKVDLFEKNLAGYNDAMSIFNSDIQNFYVQKNALQWEFDNKDALKQAGVTEKNNPEDYRVKKIIGLVEFLSGNYGVSNQKLNFVYHKNMDRAVPVYILSLSSSKKFKEAEGVILSLLKGGTENVQLSRKLGQLVKFKDKIEEKKLLLNLTTDKSPEALTTEIEKNSRETEKKITELLTEMDKKVNQGMELIGKVYKKSFLELETSNVPVYKEVGQFYLNNDDLAGSKEYFSKILRVQPLNVDINFTLGVKNESLGYWKSAMKNYEICINNQPTNSLARNNYFDLQKEYSPSLAEEFTIFGDTYDGESIVKRMKNSLVGTYPMNDYLTLKLGHEFLKIEDSGGATTGGQEFFPSDGSSTRQSILAGAMINMIPLQTKLYLGAMGNIYSGSVDYDNPALDSDISYSSINYSAQVGFSPFVNTLTLKLGYAYEDEADLSQGLKQEFRDAITAQVYSAAMDLNFREFNFPLSDRLFLYDSIIYKNLSDSNARTSMYNQLTFRALRIINRGINLDLHGVYSYESSKFVEYDSGPVVNLPYWAPDKISSYAGGLKFSHTIEGLMGGEFTYSIHGKYNYEAVKYKSENFAQKGYSCGLSLNHKWNKVEAYMSYDYSTSTADATDSAPNPAAYKSSEFKFGVTGKFFSPYTATGRGATSLALAAVYPDIVTADGDGKDDYANISLTAFDERGIENWRVDIFNSSGKKVNSIGQTGTPPSKIKWDGTDKAANLLPQGEYYCQFTIENTATKRYVSPKQRIFLSRKKSAVTIATNYRMFSPNRDGVKDLVSVEVSTTDKSEVRNWTLFVKRDNKAKSTVRTITGREFLPFDIKWDGKDSGDREVKDGKYTLSLQVKFKNGKIAASPTVPVEIKSRVNISLTADSKAMMPKKSEVKIFPSSTTKEFDKWQVKFYSENKTLFKIFQGSGKLPDYLSWNGVDKQGKIAGYNLPVFAEVEVVDLAGNKKTSNRAEIFIDFEKSKSGATDTIYMFDQGIIHKRKKINYTKAGEKIISRLKKEIGKTRGKTLKVISYTSRDGSEESNKKLTEKRAKQLADILKGVGGKKITFEGRGETKTFKSDESRWDDRYVIEVN